MGRLLRTKGQVTVMAAGMQFWVPGFGEALGHGADGGIVISAGDRIAFRVEGNDGQMVGATMSAEEAEQLAGHLIKLALKVRQQRRANKKSMEGTN